MNAPTLVAALCCLAMLGLLWSETRDHRRTSDALSVERRRTRVLRSRVAELEDELGAVRAAARGLIATGRCSECGAEVTWVASAASWLDDRDSLTCRHTRRPHSVAAAVTA